jgi:alpha-L-arabinofuranosidase
LRDKGENVIRLDLSINPRRVIGRRDPKIYGHFIEHFHRQIYGGIYDPGSPLADREGFRADVLEGTDEFIAFCRKVGAEPYICTNAGSGTPEEMSAWVEYCNLEGQGSWARLRAQNVHPHPHGVRYWSIGNENYGDWEIGAKAEQEWGRYVKEAAKIMRAVDPSIQLMAASVPELDWVVQALPRHHY